MGESHLIPGWVFVVLSQIGPDDLDLTHATLEMEGSPLGVAVYVTDGERYCSLRMNMASASKHLLGEEAANG